MTFARMFKGKHRRGTLAVTAAAGAAALALGSLGNGQSTIVPRAVAAEGETAALLPEPGLRLLSQAQYLNTIEALFGADINVRIRFAPVKRTEGLLAVGSSAAVLTSGGLDPLDAAARAVADQVMSPARRQFLVPCRPADASKADERCAREFLSATGRLLFRKPLSEQDLSRYTSMAAKATGPAGGFYPGLGHALAGMLVSPQFLYIRESVEPDPRSGWRLDGYSKAARLSYLLWNSAPDDQLLAAAARGDLHDSSGLRRQFERMVASPRYKDGVREFFNDFLVLEQFDNLAKDPTIYPAFSLKAVTEAREQILRTVVNHLVTERADYRDLFTTRTTMMTSELATIYRVPVATGSLGWVPYTFPENDPRGGILTQVGFLAQHAHAGRSSATRRGRAVREVLLCQKVPDPPPNVDFSNFEDPAGTFTTAREKLKAHNENPICAGCHKVTDPIGLALENFDGAGQFRLAEGTAKIDPGGELDGIAFTTPAGLGKALAANPALKSCLMNRLFAYSTGRPVQEAEEPRLEQYQSTLDKRGYRFDEMLRLIVTDPKFFSIKPQVVSGQVALAAPPKGRTDAH